MNRSARRLNERLARPSGAFVGELQRRADQRAYEAALRERMQEEANGAPIPGDVLERMSKPKPEERLWQIGVTEREGGNVLFLGPMMNEDAIRNIAADVNRQIATSGRRDWTKADAYPMTPINGVQ